MSKHAVYRDGKIHVMAEPCSSCIFRSVNDGRIQGLRPGRVGSMVVEARENDSVIPCHNTIYEPDKEPAVCKGYFDKSAPHVVGLRLAIVMGLIVFVEDKEE